eukprot:jgi/Hompol1/2855/HPOL_006196-RA
MSRDKLKLRLDDFSSRLDDVANRFQLAIQLNFSYEHNYRVEMQEQKQDDRELENMLEHLVQGQGDIITRMGLQQNDILEALQAIERRLQNAEAASTSTSIMSQMRDDLRRHSNRSSEVLELADWTVTSYDVDIGEPIAQGTYGEVCIGRFVGNVKVAVKRLHASNISEDDKRDFVREVLIWKDLNHPNIQRMLGACLTVPRPFVISPYMRNGNIIDYLIKNPFASNLVSLLHEISQGMSYLHFRNVIHGDLKGVNVLIDDANHAILTDFGFAKLDKSLTSRGRRSIQNKNAVGTGGTLRWMAPEILRGGEITKQSDVYSFGITTFEVMSRGQLPFGEYSDTLIYPQVVYEKRRPPRPDQCPDSVWSLMEICWSDEPSDRMPFETIEKKLAYIQSALNTFENASSSRVAQTATVKREPMAPEYSSHGSSAAMISRQSTTRDSGYNTAVASPTTIARSFSTLSVTEIDEEYARVMAPVLEAQRQSLNNIYLTMVASRTQTLEAEYNLYKQHQDQCNDIYDRIVGLSESWVDLTHSQEAADQKAAALQLKQRGFVRQQSRMANLKQSHLQREAS